VWHWWYDIKVIYVCNFFPILCTGVLLPSLPTVVHCFSDKLGTAWVPEMVAAVHFRIVLLYWCKFTPCSHFVCCCHHCRSLTDCCLYANHLILLEYCFSTYCGNAYTAIKFTHFLNFFERALTREKPWPGHLCVRLQFTNITYQSRYLWVRNGRPCIWCPCIAGAAWFHLCEPVFRKVLLLSLLQTYRAARNWVLERSDLLDSNKQESQVWDRAKKSNFWNLFWRPATNRKSKECCTCAA